MSALLIHPIPSLIFITFRSTNNSRVKLSDIKKTPANGPAFSYVNDLLEQGELKELAGLLYFTDGKGRYPAKRPDYRTAFLFLEDYDEAAVPPWAMRLLLEKEEFLN